MTPHFNFIDSKRRRPKSYALPLPALVAAILFLLWVLSAFLDFLAFIRTH